MILEQNLMIQEFQDVGLFFRIWYNIQEIRKQIMSKYSQNMDMQNGFSSEEMVQHSHASNHSVLTKINKCVYIRADTIPNQKLVCDLFKIFMILLSLTYVFKLIPSAFEVQVFEPTVYNTSEAFDVFRINPFSRLLKIYLLPSNESEPIDEVSKLQVYELQNLGVEKQKVLEVELAITNSSSSRKKHLSQYAVTMKEYKLKKNAEQNKQIPGEETTVNLQINPPNQPTKQKAEEQKKVEPEREIIKYYLGDIHILEQPAYRVKIYKPEKEYPPMSHRLLQNSDHEDPIALETNFTQDARPEQVNLPENSSLNISEQANKTTQQIERQEKERLEEEKKEEERKKKEQEERKRKEEEERQKEEQAKREEQEREKKQKQREKQKQKEREKERLQLEKYLMEKQQFMDHTNLKLEVYAMTKFSTVVELIIRFISALVIIYAAADNPEAPPGFWIICALTTNPLIFIQLSFPNKISNIIDAFCYSAPLLYPAIWLFYVHMNKDQRFYTKKELRKIQSTKKVQRQGEKQQNQFNEKNFIFAIKMLLPVLVYLLNVLRLLHFSSILYWQTLAILLLSTLFTFLLWNTYLNISQQHHRDAVFMLVSAFFLVSWILFRYLSRGNGWMELMSYIVIQSYGIFMMHLFGRQKNKEKDNYLEQN